MPPVPPPSGTSPQRGPRHRGQLTEVSLSTATDESPKGLQGDGRHSAQSDQTQQHTQTTRQHTHTPSRPENARKTRTRCISIMARTRCISIMARLMAWSNAFITFERPSPPPTPWRRNRARRCAGTRGHDEPSQLNPAMLVPGRSTRTPPCSPLAGHNARGRTSGTCTDGAHGGELRDAAPRRHLRCRRRPRGQRRRPRGQRRQPRRRPRGQRRRPPRARARVVQRLIAQASTAAWAASTAVVGSRRVSMAAARFVAPRPTGEQRSSRRRGCCSSGSRCCRREARECAYTVHLDQCAYTVHLDQCAYTAHLEEPRGAWPRAPPRGRRGRAPRPRVPRSTRRGRRRGRSAPP